jgi:hypothetical protein
VFLQSQQQFFPDLLDIKELPREQAKSGSYDDNLDFIDGFSNNYCDHLFLLHVLYEDQSSECEGALDEQLNSNSELVAAANKTSNLCCKGCIIKFTHHSTKIGYNISFIQQPMDEC